ncbi:MAG: hypothetical protein GWO24_15560, partial [Akkermansiaceae bacterium]|nr:hypothetical protein [Akkermansiaceae bacterium]
AWRLLYRAQDGWSAERGHPPLLAHLGTSLVERAMIDAYCRGTGQSFATAVRENNLEID